MLIGTLLLTGVWGAGGSLQGWIAGCAYCCAGSADIVRRRSAVRVRPWRRRRMCVDALRICADVDRSDHWCGQHASAGLTQLATTSMEAASSARTNPLDRLYRGRRVTGCVDHRRHCS